MGVDPGIPGDASDSTDYTALFAAGRAVLAYQHENYGGSGRYFTLGNHYRAELGNLNDQITAFKIPPGLKVIGYDDDGFTGTRWEYTGNVPNVGQAANDKISSITVVGYDGAPGAITGAGASWNTGAGKYPPAPIIGGTPEQQQRNREALAEWWRRNPNGPPPVDPSAGVVAAPPPAGNVVQAYTQGYDAGILAIQQQVGQARPGGYQPLPQVGLPLPMGTGTGYQAPPPAPATRDGVPVGYTPAGVGGVDYFQMGYQDAILRVPRRFGIGPNAPAYEQRRSALEDPLLVGLGAGALGYWLGSRSRKSKKRRR